MSYYIRVIGNADPDISVDELMLGLESRGLKGKLEIDESETNEQWSVMNVSDIDGQPLAQVERNPVRENFNEEEIEEDSDDFLGNLELEELLEEIQDCRPKSAVKWLTKYLKNAKVIYAFQMLGGAFASDCNFELVASIREMIWNKTGGLLQADNEGFTNDEGYHILWQFSDDVTGNWNCAVINILGKWEKFSIDLGNQEHRKRFLAGKVPNGAIRLD